MEGISEFHNSINFAHHSSVALELFLQTTIYFILGKSLAMLTNSTTNRKRTYQKECIDSVSISTLLSALNVRLQVHMIRNGLNLYYVASVRGHEHLYSSTYFYLFVSA